MSLKHPLFLLLVLCAFTLFMGNRYLPVDIMESRNLATAQEMVEYGNYLTPTLNGAPRFEKPPLPTWGAALVEHLAPHSIGAQRSLSGLMATLWVIFSFLLVSELANRRQALWTAAILATSYLAMFMARNATWDIWCHSLLTGGLWLYARAAQRPGRQWPPFLMAGILFGLSFMSKGPIALYALLLPFIPAYHWAFRPSMQGKWPPLIGMALAALAVSAWWYVYLLLFAQDEISHVMHKETTAWVSHSVRPWWYYWSFCKETGIWCAMLLISLVMPIMNKSIRQDRSQWMGTAWTLACVFLLSLFPEKKARYLLPLMLPAACCMGAYMYSLTKRRKLPRAERNTLRIHSALLAAVCLALAVVLTFFNPLHLSFSPSLVIITCSFVMAGTAFLYDATHRNRTVLTPVAAILLMALVSTSFFPLLHQAQSSRQRTSLRSLHDLPAAQGLPCYYMPYEELRPEVIYAVGHRILPLDTTAHPSKTQTVAPRFLLITAQWPNAALPLQGYSCTDLGIFDENWKSPGQSGHRESLVRHAVLVDGSGN